MVSEVSKTPRGQQRTHETHAPIDRRYNPLSLHPCPAVTNQSVHYAEANGCHARIDTVDLTEKKGLMRFASLY